MKFCEKLIDRYFAAEDEKRRHKVSDALLALSKTSMDVFTTMESILLPFTFFASHDVDEYCRTVFISIWDQHGGSPRNIQVGYASHWRIGDLIMSLSSVAEATGQFSDANIKLIWPVLDKVLALKSFTGKEKVLESFPVFVEKANCLRKDDALAVAHQKKIALCEAKRNNAEYKSHAFPMLWKFANIHTDLDLLDEIATVVGIDSTDWEANAIHTDLAANALSALAHGYSINKLSEDPFAIVSTIVTHTTLYLTEPSLAPIRRKVWYQAIAELMVKASAVRPCLDGDFAVADRLLQSLDLETVEVGTEAQRIARVAALEAVVSAWKKGLFGETGKEENIKLLTIAQAGLERERGVNVQRRWQKVLDQLKQLNE
ncbi:Proteasome-associated protein ECM29 -like protein [Ceratocystis lukuohia]|uniref:Proteasome-associated protein ECM29 -like protein n=1 Tax=Ceratocystis lukuohia TaxID=2019550 RepID=A0ABR4MFW6_9PEZI